MNEPRPLASLSASMLMRRAAPRRQSVPLPKLEDLPAALLATLDEAAVDEAPAPVAHPERLMPAAPAMAPASAPASAPEDPLVTHAPLYRPLPSLSGGRRRRDLAAGQKAAFTLRLDAQRHLKLRLAAAIAGQSAQALTIAALDRLFAQDPLIDMLAQQAGTLS